MKKISNRDAMRVLAHLQKARGIIEKLKESSDDGEIEMDSKIAEDCIGHIAELEILLNNTLYE